MAQRRAPRFRLLLSDPALHIITHARPAPDVLVANHHRDSLVILRPPPAASRPASTPSGAISRTRSTSPSPYVVGSAPSERRYSWLLGLAVPITRAPRERAICTAALPTAPAAPLTTIVVPELTPKRSNVRTAVSTATGRLAAAAKSSDGGIGA